MQVLAREEGQFVGVLARGRNTYRSGPVPVQVAHLEGQPVLQDRIGTLYFRVS